jgi:hypothetical protein
MSYIYFSGQGMILSSDPHLMLRNSLGLHQRRMFMGMKFQFFV